MINDTTWQGDAVRDVYQLRHPQNSRDPKMARLAAEMACSLHPDREFLGQSDRALLRRHHRKANPARRPPLHRGTGNRDLRCMDAGNEDPKPFRWTKSADLILAAIKRFCLKNPRNHLSPNRNRAKIRIRTLANAIARYNRPPRVCAVTRRRFPVGASPTRQPLQPEATGAVMEVTKWLKPSV